MADQVVACERLKGPLAPLRRDNVEQQQYFSESRSRFKQRLASRGLERLDVPHDGSCLFVSLCFSAGLALDHSKLLQEIVAYLRRFQSEFTPWFDNRLDSNASSHHFWCRIVRGLDSSSNPIASNYGIHCLFVGIRHWIHMVLHVFNYKVSPGANMDLLKTLEFPLAFTLRRRHYSLIFPLAKTMETLKRMVLSQWALLGTSTCDRYELDCCTNVLSIGKTSKCSFFHWQSFVWCSAFSGSELEQATWFLARIPGSRHTAAFPGCQIHEKQKWSIEFCCWFFPHPNGQVSS